MSLKAESYPKEVPTSVEISKRLTAYQRTGNPFDQIRSAKSCQRLVTLQTRQLHENRNSLILSDKG
ncbi:hypothetical protein J6590_097689 [Homalodisca vitripennis]|nr:hypothetical protein J6590_097689 [Homalodisca vitripennis]